MTTKSNRCPSKAYLQGAIDICKEFCGATDEQFDGIWYSRGGLTEWRFQGDFGFGGKLWWDGRSFCITFYREDHTLKREEARDKANKAMSDLYKQEEGYNGGYKGLR